MDDYTPRRGDHLYVWRKIRLYQHHGIVVTKDDIVGKLEQDLHPKSIEDLMIVEQNIHGLGIVTIKQFRTEHPFDYAHSIGCARYRTDPMEYYLNRSGTCYLTKRLEVDVIVANALKIFSNKKERDIWKTYSLILRNCEQFAFICSTNLEYVLGEQVLMGCNIVKCVFMTGMYNAIKLTMDIFRNFAQQMASGMSAEMLIKTNGLASLSIFAVEGFILSVRLLVYYFYPEDREKNLARKFAITPEDYFQKMIQTGFGSLAAFGAPIMGMAIGSTLFISAMAPTVCSILFGFFGYIAARWLTGLIAIKIREKWNGIEKKELTVHFKNLPGDEYDTAEIVDD